MLHLKLFENFDKKRDLILLIGPPGSGKSFYIKQLKGDYIIINRDDIITEVAEEYGVTYMDVYRKQIAKIHIEADKRVDEKFKDAVRNTDSNIVIDMTNKTVKDRNRFTKKVLRREFNIIAVVFNKGGYHIMDLLKQVNKKRNIELAGKKEIPEEAVESHISNYVAPTKLEGFNEIIHIDNSEDLRKYVELEG